MLRPLTLEGPYIGWSLRKEVQHEMWCAGTKHGKIFFKFRIIEDRCRQGAPDYFGNIGRTTQEDFEKAQAHFVKQWSRNEC